jgi:hypothetical protein
MKKKSYREMSFDECVNAMLIVTRQGIMSSINHYKNMGDSLIVNKLIDARTVSQNKNLIAKLEAENNEIVTKYS